MNAPAQLTYLPADPTGRLYRCLAHQDYEAFATEIAAELPYERVGYDRLLAIWVDLQERQIAPPAEVLDVGCNNGLFSLGLGAAGYRVTGIENNIATAAKSGYPARLLDEAITVRDRLGWQQVSFHEMDIADYLTRTTTTPAVGLLLSVVHQWFAGYASTGQGEKSLAEIEKILRAFFSRIGRVVYYEGPETEPAAADVPLPLPQWFQTQGWVTHITPLAVSVAANSHLRTLYRLERR